MKISSSLLLPDPKTLEASLEIPPGFLVDLPDESDWSFVVKSHALLEAALAKLLAVRAEPRLAVFFRRLPFSGNRNCKIAVARDLGLIDEHLAQFLATFAKVRNNLVHDVRLVRFNLESYVSNLDEATFRASADAFGSVFEELRGKEAIEARRELAQLHLRYLLHFAVMVSVAKMHFVGHPDDLVAAEREWNSGDRNHLMIVVLALVVMTYAAQQKRKDEPKLP